LRRRFLLIAADVLLIPLSVWLSFWLRLADPWSPLLQDSLWMFPAAWLIALPLYALTGQYKGLTRYVGSGALYRLAGRNGLLVLLLAMAGVMLQVPLPPRSSWVLLWLLLTGLTGMVRFALRDALLKLQDGIGQNRVRFAIYGAGAAGAQLAASLRLAGGEPPEAWAMRMQAGNDGSWRVSFSDYAELESLLAALREGGLRVTEMQLQEPDLEDVFTDIMKRS
jgi:FlaA1/EpsC-like NDP-sugar epimerase